MAEQGVAGFVQQGPLGVLAAGGSHIKNFASFGRPVELLASHETESGESGPADGLMGLSRSLRTGEALTLVMTAGLFSEIVAAEDDGLVRALGGQDGFRDVGSTRMI